MSNGMLNLNSISPEALLSVLHVVIMCCCDVAGANGDSTVKQHCQTFIDNLTNDPPSQYMAVIHKNYLL